jgi:hypothetical protein
MIGRRDINDPYHGTMQELTSGLRGEVPRSRRR